MALALPWYILMVQKYGATFTQEFFYNDHWRRLVEAEHASNDTWHFYPLSMVWGMFPWSLYVVLAVFYLFKNIRRTKVDIYLFLACWIAVTLAVFQFAHSKLVSYIFPLFPALAVVAGDFIYDAALFSKRVRSWFFASLGTGAFLALVVLALAVFSVIFPPFISAYVPIKAPLYVMLALFSVQAVLFFAALLRRSAVLSAYILIPTVFIAFSVIPMVSAYIEPYLSSRDAAGYLLKNYKIDNTILCSKFFARSIRYYTDKDVAAMNPYGENFFSPHPIPFLATDEAVNEFLHQQKDTYCVLKKSSLEDIARQDPEFKIEILKQIGNEYLVRVTEAKPWKKKQAN